MLSPRAAPSLCSDEDAGGLVSSRLSAGSEPAGLVPPGSRDPPGLWRGAGTAGAARPLVVPAERPACNSVFLAKPGLKAGMCPGVQSRVLSLGLPSVGPGPLGSPGPWGTPGWQDRAPASSPRFSFQMAEQLMTLAYDNGINLFDTAEVYAAGKYVSLLMAERGVATGPLGVPFPVTLVPRFPCVPPPLPAF